MKVEECIKKGKENYEESLQRAVAAEVSLRHLVMGRYGNACVLSLQLRMRRNGIAKRCGVVFFYP